MSIANPPHLGTSSGELTTYSGASSSSQIVEESLLSVLIRVFKKRVWLIVITTLAGLVGGILANIVIPTKYQAKATIEIVPDNANQFRIEQGASLAVSTVDSTKIDTEIAKLSSDSLAWETIRGLRLDQNPDFVSLKKGEFLDVNSAEARHRLITIFQSSVTAEREGHTNLVHLRFVTRKPELSARVANAMIDNYIERSFKDNYSATEQVSGWLDAQLAELKKEVQQREEQMLAAQQDLGLIGIDTTQSGLLKYLEEMNGELAVAQADRLTKEARVVALKGATPDVVETASINDPVLASLLERQSQLSTDYASLVQQFGPNYPHVKELKSQLDHLHDALAARRGALLGRAQSDYEIARQTEDSLKQTMEKSEHDALGQNSKAVQYLLAREGYEASRTLYDGLEQRLKEAGIIAGLHSTSIHVVDRADMPAYPSQPHSALDLLGGVLGGAFLGVILALVVESLDTTLRSISEIEEVLQLPLLAAVPETDKGELKPSAFAQHATATKPGKWFRMTETARNLRTSILLSRPGAPPKVLMITSTRPAEGKSSLACIGAITLALNNSRVLLIDADLRRPTIHARFAVPNKIGLSTVLTGEATYDEAIQVWEDLPSVHILPAGPAAPMPAELLGSQQMQHLIEELRDRYDFIVIDTPPVLTVTDAAILARLADGTILVIRHGEAQRNAVVRSTEVLARAGARMLGVVVNIVNFNSPEYSEYYGKRYYDYYGRQSSQSEQD